MKARIVVLMIAVLCAIVKIDGYAMVEAEHSPEDVISPRSDRLDEIMDKELQDYIYQSCKDNGIKYCLFLALCEQESQFGTYGCGDRGIYAVKSKTGDYGMCQTNKKYSWKEVRDHYGWQDDVTILYDPYRSVDAGIYMFKKCVDKYGNCEGAYDAYNRGIEHHGSTKNSRAVVRYWNKWIEEFGDI